MSAASMKPEPAGVIILRCGRAPTAAVPGRKPQDFLKGARSICGGSAACGTVRFLFLPASMEQTGASAWNVRYGTRCSPTKPISQKFKRFFFTPTMGAASQDRIMFCPASARENTTWLSLTTDGCCFLRAIRRQRHAADSSLPAQRRALSTARYCLYTAARRKHPTMTRRAGTARKASFAFRETC